MDDDPNMEKKKADKRASSRSCCSLHLQTHHLSVAEASGDPVPVPNPFAQFVGGTPSFLRGGPGTSESHIGSLRASHLSANSAARGKHKDLLEGLRAEGDDSRQFQALIELGEVLAMANEVRNYY